ncbi:MAG: serine/threonine protein kinase [Myxococcaceae bacterium]|nr:serine/threonine protein kinase [Myxococcaceae bacterium]
MPYGPYLLLKRLAVGGMAELYLAKDTRVGRMMVLKRILPYLAEEVEFLTMFLDEARIAAQLHHPNIVEVFELGRLDGTTFIAMEWVDGIDLRKVLQKEQERGAPLPPGVGAWVIARLCEGLFHAHERTADGKPLGIIHRDVSPQNVMVSYRGEVKLVDFGIAKATAWMGRSKPGVIKGKFLYLAPEQLTQEKLDHRADLFALGTLLYELTVGKSPFYRNTTEAVIYSIRMEDPPAPTEVVPGYPQALSRIVMRCLEKDRSKRYQTADEVRVALDAFIAASAPTTKDDVAHYMADLFGDDDERTSVYVPPNAQTKGEGVLAPPLPKKKGPFDDDERTASMPGARLDKPTTPVGKAVTRDVRLEPAPSQVETTEPIRPKGRDVIATAPFDVPPPSIPTLPPVEVSASARDSSPTLSVVNEDRSIEIAPTAIRTTGPTELKTGDVASWLEPTRELNSTDPQPSDPSISTVSNPPVRPPPAPRPQSRPGPPVPDEVTGPTRDDRRFQPEKTKTEAPAPPPPQAPGPVRPSRNRRPAPDARRRPAPALDPDDAIATVDMAHFEDSQVGATGRRTAIVVIGVVVAAAAALLAWALWPSSSVPERAPSKPAVVDAPSVPAPPAPAGLVKVSFKAAPGVKISVAGTELTQGQVIEVPPGDLRVTYVCPGRKKQKPRTHNVTQAVPAEGPYEMTLQCL